MFTNKSLLQIASLIALFAWGVIPVRGLQAQHPTVFGSAEFQQTRDSYRSAQFSSQSEVWDSQLSLRFDSATNMSFYKERLQPVVSQWTQSGLQRELLTVDGIRQYAENSPLRYRSKSQTGFQPSKYAGTAQLVETSPWPIQRIPRPKFRLSLPEDSVTDSNFRPVDFQSLVPASDARHELKRIQDLRALAAAEAALAKPVNQAPANQEPAKQEPVKQEPVKQAPDQVADSNAGQMKQEKTQPEKVQPELVQPELVQPQVEQGKVKTPPAKPPSQDRVAPPKQDEIGSVTAEVTKQRELVSGNETLDEITKATFLTNLDDAMQMLQHAAEFEALAKQQREAQDGFPVAVQNIQRELDQSITPENPDTNLTSDEMKLRLSTKRKSLQELKDGLKAKLDQIVERDLRVTQLPKLRTQAKENLQAIRKKLASLPAQAEGKKAQLERLKVKAEELEAIHESDLLELEAQRQEQVGTILPLERDSINRKLRSLESEVALWEAAANEKRKIEIMAQREEARAKYREAVKASPAFREIAESNQRLADMREKLSKKLIDTNQEIARLKLQCDEVDQNHTDLKNKFENGLVPSVGLLSELRDSKVQPFRSQARVQEIAAELQAIRQTRAALQTQQDSIVSEDEFVNLLMKNNEFENKEQAGEMAHDLTKTKLDYLRVLSNDFETYKKGLTDVQNGHMELSNKVTDLGDFIYDNALWVRSTEPLGKSDLNDSRRALGSFFEQQQWSELFGSVKNRMVGGPYVTALFGFILFGVFVVSRRLGRSDD